MNRDQFRTKMNAVWQFIQVLILTAIMLYLICEFMIANL